MCVRIYAWLKVSSVYIRDDMLMYEFVGGHHCQVVLLQSRCLFLRTFVLHPDVRAACIVLFHAFMPLSSLATALVDLWGILQKSAPFGDMLYREPRGEH